MSLFVDKVALVAGAAGFLGSHLTDKLLSLGFRVVALDDLSSGQLRNLNHLKGNNRFQFIEADIVNPIPDVDADFVFNLACPASPVLYQADPISTMKTSVIGTLNLLDLAHKNRAVHFQASTSEVYGDPLQHPQIESYWGNVNPLGIRSCYDEGKRAAESLCADFHRVRGTDTRIARIFNTYGPRMRPDDGRVVSNFIVQALLGKPLSVYGDGSQTRSFCYVDDLIEAIVRMVTRDIPPAMPVNIGNPNECTVLELAEKVLSLSNGRGKIEFLPLPQDDPRLRRPDISRARELLNWQPEIELSEGLFSTFEYFRGEILQSVRVA